MLLNKINPYLTTSALSLILVASVQAQSLRDPTLPSQGFQRAAMVNDKQGLVLNSVVNGAHSYAVINNKIMKVGDNVQGVRIVAIGTGHVSLSDGRKLQLFQSITER